MRRLPAVALAVLSALLPVLVSAPARAAEAPSVSVELNKLEPVATATAGQASGCRAYIVASNPEGGEAVDALRLDLVMFGTDGVIARRVALDLGPLSPGRTQVRPFDLRDQTCDSVGKILVNEVLVCRVAGTERTDCLARLRITSRATASFSK